MPFIKHGDGKIVGILDVEELTDEQKKSVKAKQAGKKPADQTASTDDSQNEKQSGR